MPTCTKVAIVGAGGWGTALAAHWGNAGFDVTLWARRPELARLLSTHRENPTYLPGVYLPASVAVVHNSPALLQQDIMVLAVPSKAMRETVRSLAVGQHTVLISAAKGIEANTYLRMSEVIASEARQAQVAVLSGPNHAEEVAHGLPTLSVLASQDGDLAQTLQQKLSTQSLRLYANTDTVGVEWGGVLKNIMALAIGIVDGLGMGDNAKAAMITRGLSEMRRFAVAYGGQAHTIHGLSGLGDLVVTAQSRHSRNRRLGLALGQGASLTDYMHQSSMVVEGVESTRNIYWLAKEKGVNMPITETLYRFLFSGLQLAEALRILMDRDPRFEYAEDWT